MDERLQHFIDLATGIHDGRYRYPPGKYKNRLTKVQIICSIHGPFWQTPAAHLGGAGCKRCADAARGATKTKKAAACFEARARSVHGDRYDLKKCEYEKSSIKVEIICPMHGSFLIRPSNFLLGVGCAECGAASSAEKQRKTFQQFLLEAREVHGNRYGYNAVNYVSYHRKVVILCSKHGQFEQTPAMHLSGSGCQKCGITKQSLSARKSKEYFLSQCFKVHGALYDYSDIAYIKFDVPVEIKCRIHGPFWQSPSKHVHSKQGCPACSNRDMDTAKFIERALASHGDLYDYSKSDYRGARKKITVICRVHGEFEQVAFNHMSGSGCSLCSDQMNSEGVRRIEQWLNDNDVGYVREKTFDSLVSKKQGRRRYKLRFDFQIQNSRKLIEFDGEQHFRPIATWGGENAYRVLQGNDRAKTSWASANNYQLLRIPYYQSEHIEKLLEEWLT